MVRLFFNINKVSWLFVYMATPLAVESGTSPGLHSLNSVEGPGLEGGPGRVSRGGQGEVHLDLHIGIAAKERGT